MSGEETGGSQGAWRFSAQGGIALPSCLEILVRPSHIIAGRSVEGPFVLGRLVYRQFTSGSFVSGLIATAPERAPNEQRSMAAERAGPWDQVEGEDSSRRRRTSPSMSPSESRRRMTR